MPLCPLQTGCPMTCCKHLSHIGPTLPIGLPDLPEVAQDCLFADTVLPCRTCRRLKTTSKVRQRNEPVRSRVRNLRSRGSTAICHPPVCWKRCRNRIINYCVSVTTERSTDFRDVVATSMHRLCLNSLILIQSRHVQWQALWNQMCFSLCSGYKDYDYTHFLCHVPSPRTASANQAILCIANLSQNFGPARDRFYIGSMYCVLRTNHAKFAKETSAYFRNIQH